MKATPEMIAAGAEAARKYMEETGGNNPAVIWDAMWAAQPEQEPLSEEREFWLSVVDGLDKKPESPTQGMTLGQRISHVGGRENAAGYIEFGSPMAVKALIDHVLRDTTPQQRKE